MKTMKNLLMSMAFILSVGLMSCDENKLNEDVAPQEEVNQRSRLANVNNSMLNATNIDQWEGLNLTDLSQNIQDHLNENYPGVGAEEIWQTETGEYIVLLENDMVVIFNSGGEVVIAFDLAEILGDFDDEDWDWDEVDPADLPQSIKDYITSNYSDATIEEAGIDPETKEYIVVLDNGTWVIFDEDGNFVEEFDEEDLDFDEDWDFELDEVDPADLPQNIKDYITQNYPNATIEEAGIDPETGDYIVILDNDLCIIFDEDGNFLEEIDESEFGDDEDWDEVDPAELPQTILDYLAANYTDVEVEGAAKNSESGEFVVFLANGTVVEFDEDGNFVEEYDEEYEDCVEVAVEDLPQAIRDYVASNYADNSIVEAYFSEEDKEYYIVLDNDTELIFDEDGNFIEADSGN